MNQPRISHLCPLAGALVLLLAGCGAYSAGHRSPSPAASTGAFAQPSAEGTGPEPPLQPSTGGVSLSVASLPVGDGGSNPTPDGQAVCIDVSWLGKLRPSVTLTVTNVVVDGPFTPVDLSTAGCTADDGPPCVGLRLTAADNDGTTCAAGVKWTGVRGTEAAVELAGLLSCPGLDPACQQARDRLESMARASGPDSFDFDLPPDTSSPSSPVGTSPTAPASSNPASPASPNPTPPANPNPTATSTAPPAGPSSP